MDNPITKFIFGALGISTLIGSAYLYYFQLNYYGLKKIKGYNESNALKIQQNDFRSEKPSFVFRVLDLDGAVLLQDTLISEIQPKIVPLNDLGPPIRMDSSFSDWFKFEQRLTDILGTDTDDEIAHQGPIITFFGSNDFHHLTLGLIRRFKQPFNFVIFDNHPDWFQMYPGLHCGSWVNHVLDLPTVKQAFHLGGHSGEFEDTVMKYFQPWKDLIGGKMKVMPAVIPFKNLRWDQVKQTVLREKSTKTLTKERILEIFEPYKEILSKYPLYITLDKDVMLRRYSLQNWNSGLLTRNEVLLIIEVLIQMSGGRLLAMDITGDFSKVKVSGLFRSYLHSSQHDDEENNIDQDEATKLNEYTNRLIVKKLSEVLNIPLNINL